MNESQIVDFVSLMMMASVPYILAAQGTMLPGRTGLFFVSQEAIMMVGASVGFLVSYHMGSLFLGMVAAMIAGGIFGLVLAYFTTSLKMDQFVIGLATFFLGLGIASLLFKLFVGVTLTPVRSHKRGQPISGVGPSHELDEAIFSAHSGAVVGPVAIPNRGAAVARVEALTVLGPEELRAAMASTRKALENQRVNDLISSILEEARRETVITVNQQLINRFAPQKQAG